MEIIANQATEEKELQFLKINLSRNKGEISLPCAIPVEMPKILDDNINNITIKELNKLCDSWSILRYGKRKGDLIQVIREQFLPHKEEIQSESKISNNKLGTYIDELQYLKENKFTKLEFMNWINTKTKCQIKGDYQESLALSMLYSKIDGRFDDYVAHNPTAFAVGDLIPIPSLDRFFSEEKIRKGGSTADLVFVNNKKKDIWVFSSKNFAKTKGIGKYDITKIIVQFDNYYKDDDYSLKIGLIVRDSGEFREKERNANESSNYLKGDYEVIDQNDLWEYWCLFHNKYPDMKNLDEKILKIDNVFTLRFGQKVICDQVAKRIRNNEKIILNGSDCRFGKSYCMAQDVLSSGMSVVLFLTSQPKTIPSIESIFKKYPEFSQYRIFNLNTPLGLEKFKSKPKGKAIILISIQTIRSKAALVLGDVDMVIIDEFHESGFTEKTSNVFSKYKLNTCLRIFYTATYQKVRSFYRIPNENIFAWNQEDNAHTAASDWDSLQSRHSSVNIEEILKGFLVTHVVDHYKRMVSFYFMVSKTSDKCISDFREINSHEETKNHGYSWKSVSMLSKNSELKTPDAVINYFQLFFGCMKTTKGDRKFASEEPYTMKDYFDKCNQIGQRIDANGKPLIIPIYMGQVVKEGSNEEKSIIDKVSHKVRDLLIERSRDFIEPLQNYKIVVYNSMTTGEIIYGNETIESGFERLVNKNSDKKGIILLLGSALNTGITNKYCDLIKLNCEIKSFERFYQTISRAKNEAPKGQVKKHAFIAVDNYQGIGCLLDLIPYYQHRGESTKQTFLRIYEQKLINIAEVGNKQSLSDIKFDNFLAEGIYRNLKNTHGVVDECIHLIENINFDWDIIQYNSVIKCIFGDISKKQNSLLERVESLMNKPVDGIKEGVEEIKETFNTDSKEINQNDLKEVDNIKANCMTVVVRDITLLFALFSVSRESKKLVDLIKWANTEKIFGIITITQIIKKQLIISFPKLKGNTSEGIPNVDKLWDIFVKLMSLEYHREGVEKIVEDVKESFKSRFNDLKELYNQLTQVFKPTEEARTQNAEILTPINLAQKMIDLIPDDVWSSAATVFEPTCGKGVFIYLAYNKFKKAGIPREKIIKECIYYADINYMNVWMCRFLLDPQDEYSLSTDMLNLHIGDTLNLDVKKKWGIDKFRVIIGNPPYTGTLWKKFTLFAWNLCYIVVFVIPSAWVIAISQKAFVEKIKSSGLKDFTFLRNTCFDIGIETCYFLTETGYNSDIFINNIPTNRETELCDYSNISEISLFKKLSFFNTIVLNKGKNKTLNHNKPTETGNVNFKKSKTHNKKLVSRLGGGNEEIYWCKTLEQKDLDSHKLIFPRGTASYNSKTRILDRSRPMVYSRHSHDEYLSTGLVYFTTKTKIEIIHLKKYFECSKLVRYLFLKKNSASELTIGFCSHIPIIPLNKEMSDVEIFEYFDFSNDEIEVINKTVS
jgi:hypothetical protein